jgi:hypothetical protein
VFAVIATGFGKLACCHPDAVSLLKVTVASCAPVLLHSVPVWMPVLAVAL